MLQSFWFIIKSIILVGILIAVINLSGEVSVNMLGYSAIMQTNIFFLFLLLFITLLFFTYKILRGFFSIPKKLSKKREETRHQKGFNALTQGLVAIAAGDPKQATYYSRRAKNLLPMNQNNEGGQQALHLLLEAQAARMRGEETLAQNRFELLMQDKEAGFLGIRGLLKAAMDKGNNRLALEYAQQAAKLHPHQPWVIKTLYYLQIKNKKWDAVLKTALQAKKYNAIEKEKITSDEIAIYLMRYDYDITHDNESGALINLKQAYKLDETFIPTSIRYAEYYIQKDKNKKAASLVKKTWASNPHPDLAKIWTKLSPLSEKSQDKRMKWFKTLFEINPQNIESHIIMANAAMDMGLWGEAKSYVVTAEKIQPSARIYRLRAIVEQNTSHNEDSIHDLMGKASQANPDKVWVCSQTGIIYEEWTPIAKPHDSFNSIIWDYPGVLYNNVPPQYGVSNNQNELMIDPA